jgi:hypothetical protein
MVCWSGVARAGAKREVWNSGAGVGAGPPRERWGWEACREA